MFDVLIAGLVILTVMATFVSTGLEIFQRIGVGPPLRHLILRWSLEQAFVAAGKKATEVIKLLEDDRVNPGNRRFLVEVEEDALKAYLQRAHAEGPWSGDGFASWWRGVTAVQGLWFRSAMLVIGAVIGTSIAAGLRVDALALGPALKERPGLVAALGSQGAQATATPAANSTMATFYTVLDAELATSPVRAEVVAWVVAKGRSTPQDAVLELEAVAQALPPEDRVADELLASLRQAVPAAAAARVQAVAETKDADAAMRQSLVDTVGGDDPETLFLFVCGQAQVTLCGLAHFATGDALRNARLATADLESAVLAAAAARDTVTRDVAFAGLPLSRRPFLGYLLTGVFAAMGAPFWFDLLRRLTDARQARASA